MVDTTNSFAHQRDVGSALNANAPIDLARVLAIFSRHLRLFLIVFAVIAALVLFLTLSGAPRYTATATLLINEHTSDVLHLNAVTPTEAAENVPVEDTSAVDTEVEILGSRALAAKVVDQLDLGNDPEFNGALRRPGLLSGFMHLFAGGSSLPASPEEAAERTHEQVVSAVIRGLKVKRTGETYTIDLSFTALEPARAAQIANAFLQEYLTERVNSKTDENQSATSWLDTRLTQLRDQLKSANAAVEEYKSANNLMSAAGVTLTEQEISNINTELAQARAQQAEADAELKTAQRQLAAGSNGGDVGQALDSPVIGSLRTQRAQQSAVVADLQSRYGYDHPQLIKAQRALADIDNQIQVEIARVISNLKAKADVAHTRTASLEASVAGTKSTLSTNGQAMVKLDELVSNATAAQGVYDAFMSRYKEALAKEGIQPVDAKVVTPARLPTGPSSPNKPLDLAIAIALGLVFAVITTLVADLLRRGVSSVADAEAAFDLPAIGEIPTLASTLKRRFGRRQPPSPARYVVDKPLSRFAESFRNLRAAILTSRTGKKVQVIAITSSLPGEGKTTTTLCLARTIALSSAASVVVVDCDLRQRSLNKALRAEPDVGLLEVLNGTSTLDRALVQDPESSAALLLVSNSSFTPRDVFGSEAMHKLLQDLRARFDIVLLDTAPVLAVADTRVLCPQADVVLFLTRWRKTSRHAVQSALRILQSDSIFIGGVALTQVNIREQARSGEGAGNYYRDVDSYYTG